MTIIKGQIESLRRVKEELDQCGITRFSSIADINAFLKEYPAEKDRIIDQVEIELESEIAMLEVDLSRFEKEYDALTAKVTNDLKEEIAGLEKEYTRIKAKDSNFFIRFIDYFKLRRLKSLLKDLKSNFDLILARRTSTIEQKVLKTKNRLTEYTTNMDKVIADRALPLTNDLEYTKEVVDGLYPQIAGAVGENLVVKELEKLSNQNILFNDFYIKFNKPIYNPKQRDKIYSIQIDHLLVTSAGIFILETKNWSKKSIQNYNLRSPIKQIRRTSYALYKILDGNGLQAGVNLTTHHWGEKKIPIRNLIVMVNHKPKAEFKHVKVLTLKELIGYINYFDPVFDQSDINRITKFLDRKRSSYTFNSMDAYGKKLRELNRPRYKPSRNVYKPNLHTWLKQNPGMGINDYYSKYGV